jgi:GAF domain-containing protein
MTDGREHEIIRAFVDLSNELVDDYDVVHTLGRLTASCASLLDIAFAGLLLADENGVLQVAASSSERARDLEILELQRVEGPCLDCYRTGQPVLVPDLQAVQHRWSDAYQAARSIGFGFASVHALPMRVGDTVLGTLGLFGDGVGSLGQDHLALAQALAHVASVAVVNERLAASSATTISELRLALSSRVVVEQAKGVIAQLGNVEMSEAFEALRRYARDQRRRLGDVAREVVNGELPGESVLRHARSAAILPGSPSAGRW